MSDYEQGATTEASMDTSAEGIAIIGLAGRFPGARDIEAFWRNLRDGVESITFFTPEQLQEAGLDPAILEQPNFVAANGMLEDIDRFDAAFFGYTPREAQLIDPQQRLFLECAQHTLEHAGYDPARFDGRIGLFGGAGANYYLLGNLVNNRALIEEIGVLQILLANEGDYLCSRVSYKLDLRGPVALVQSACSTALVSVHMACQSLLTGECEMALAGGVSIGLPQDQGYFYTEGGILSRDGHCRSFDASSTGTVNGNGVGLVALKRLEDALEDGDVVHAVLLGSAINNDGASKVGFTAPSVECQSEVVGEALGVTGVDAETIAYIETHGSGTALGDPIEAQALIDAYADHAETSGYCGIGSVKSNIGHTNAAAGVAGLIKVVQGLEHGEIPPSLHFEQLNPEIDFTDTPFFVNAELRPWPRLKDQPRRAAISSFGLGGTNAHAIVQEAPAVEPSGPSRGHQLLLVSARSEAALDAATRNLADHLQAHPDLKLADAAFTLQLGRAEMDMRRAVVVRDDGGEAGKKAAIEALRAEPVATKVDKDTRPVVFLLPGLGDHYVQLGRRLYEDEPTFREDFDACAEGLLEPLGVDIREILFPGAAPPEPTDEEAAAGTDFKALLRRGGGEVDEATARLNRTVHAQPALFAVEYALARLLMDWGLEPSGLIGYSLGEYVAACLAGVLELDDALALVAKRARLIDDLPEGAMLAVPLPESELLPKLKKHPDLDLCATNGPNLSVAGGPVPAVDALEQELQAAGVTCIRLTTTHAFHTRMMAPVAEALTELASGFELQTPEIPLLSNVTGTWLSDADATDPAYWARHLCGTVRFAESLSELLKDARRLLIELGPGNALGTLIKQHPSVKPEQVVISALRHQSERRSDVAHLLRALGHAWLAGARIDWHGFYAHETRRRVVLPGYPFERRRYWIDPNPAESGAAGKRGRAGSGGGQVGIAEMRKGKLPLADWFYLPSWRQTPTRLPADGRAPEDAMETGRWLIFLEADSDAHGVGGDLLRRLRAAGHDVIGVRAGDAYAAASEGGAEGDGVFTVRPSERGDYLSLLRQLKEDGELSHQELPSRILHLWSLTEEHPSFDVAQAHGLHSLMALVQAYADIDAGAPLRLGVVGNRLQDVAGGEGVEAEKAPLVGACRVIPQELPHAWAAAIDVVLPPPEGQNRRRRLVDQLLAEMTVAPTSADAAWSTPVIALRGPHRWVQDFEPVPLPPATGKAGSATGDQPPRLRQGGSYLVTDGTSELGQELTEFLLRRFGAQVTAVLPPGWGEDAGSDEGAEPQAGEAQQAMAAALRERQARARARLDGLAEEFPSLVLEHHDVTDAAAVRQLVDGVRQRQGGLHGVLHTATDFSGGLIQVKTTADLTAVHGAVARGALALEEALSGAAADTAVPDFVLLSSTSTAVTGGLGQLDLCAAGSVLSALADRRAAAGDSHWLTVGWGSFAWDQWGLPGMMANPELQKQVRENLETYGVSAGESVDVFQRALASRQPRLVVSTQDLHTVIANTTAVTAESLLEQVSQTTELHPRGDLSVPYEAPTDDVEAQLAVIWQRLFGIDKVGIHDNFFELGGYSLLGIQMVTQVRQTFDFEIQITELFDTPTVAGLAGRIRGDESEPELDEDDMADLLSQVEGMSPEDMAALLAESDG